MVRVWPEWNPTSGRADGSKLATDGATRAPQAAKPCKRVSRASTRRSLSSKVMVVVVCTYTHGFVLMSIKHC